MKQVKEGGWKGFPSLNSSKLLHCGNVSPLGMRNWCTVLVFGTVSIASPVLAQTAPAAPASAAAVAAPAAAASAAVPSKGTAPSERAQRQADSVFRWIKIHAEKPRKAAEAKTPTKPEAAVASPRESAKAVPEDNKPARTASSSAPALEPLKAAAEKDTAVAPVAPVVASAPATAEAAPAPVEEEAAIKPIAQPKPDFPEDVMAQLGSGKVKLRFMVQPDGSVAEAEVLSTSHRRLNRAALDAIAKWRFEPIKVARPAQVELGFSLD